MRSSELERQVKLLLDHVHSHQRRGAGYPGSQEGREPNPAETEHRHALTRRDPRAVERGPHPRQHSAAEQGRDLERQLPIDPHRGLGADYGVLREGGHAEMVMQGSASGIPPAPCSGEQ